MIVNIELILKIKFLFKANIEDYYIMSISYFNSYYFNFLRKIKDISKPLKQENDNAGIIYKSVKEYYPSYDKTSSEYKDWFISNTVVKNLFNDTTLSYAEYVELLNNENNDSSLVYKNISIHNIRSVLQKDYILLHFLALFTLFSEVDVSYDDATITNIIETINNVKSLDKFNTSLELIENNRIKELLKKVYEFNSKVSTETNDSLKALEQTSLGKLAKEIMEDINIDEIQKSLEKSGENGGDLLKSLADPDSGLANLLSKVSTTMIQKMASGSIKQEDLLKDAMNFSSKLGSSSGMPGLGDMGSMLSMMQKMTRGAGGAGAGGAGAGGAGAGGAGAGGAGAGGADSDDDSGFDMSALQNIMKSMGGMGGMGGRGNGGGKGREDFTTRIDDSKMRRVIKQKQLKKKLDERKKEQEKAKENI